MTSTTPHPEIIAETQAEIATFFGCSESNAQKMLNRTPAARLPDGRYSITKLMQAMTARGYCGILRKLASHLGPGSREREAVEWAVWRIENLPPPPRN